MKRLLAALISVIMIGCPQCLLANEPVLTVASTNMSSNANTLATDPLDELDFSNIQAEIAARNPTIKTSMNAMKALAWNYGALDQRKGSVQTSMLETKDLIVKQTAKMAEIENALMPDELAKITDPSVRNSIKLNLESLLGMYQANVANLTLSYATLENQLTTLENQYRDASMTVHTLSLQNQLLEGQLTYTVQNMFFMYNNLQLQLQDLENKKATLEKQKKIAVLKESLGLGKTNDITQLELSLTEIESAIDSLNQQMKFIICEINIILDQDYDHPLQILKVPDFDLSAVDAIDYESDSEIALGNSFDIKLQRQAYDEKNLVLERLNEQGSKNPYVDLTSQKDQAQNDLHSEEMKLDEQINRFKFAFFKLHTEVLNKQSNFKLKQGKYTETQKQLENTRLMYDLGMVSSFALNSFESTFKSEELQVEQAKRDLYLSYLKYQWAKKGLLL